MKPNRLMWAVIVCLFAGIELWAQQPNTLSEGLGSNPSDALKVPRLIKFNGAMKDFSGKPLRGPVDINFAIYKEQTDAEPLWQEMQTLQLDEQGRYTVLLGAMQPQGLPMGLFSSGEARWLEVNAAGTELQPRTLLVSVPYALKASDAETLGGKPASAYLLAPVNQTGSGTTQPTKGSGTAATGNTTIVTPAVITPSVTYGTANYIPLFTDNAGDMGNSTLYQLGTQVGIATTTPGTLNGHYFPSLLLDAAQATASTYLTADTELQGGYAGVLLNRGAATANNRDWAIENQPDSTLTSSQFAISTYNDAGYPTAMLMVTRSGLVGIGTTTPTATLEVNGTARFDSSVAVASLTSGYCVQAGAGGLLTTTLSPCGSSSGGGTITGVAAGTDLTGGGTSGTVTLNLDTTKVPTLGSNTFRGTQTINGEVYASVTSGEAVAGTSSDPNGVGAYGVNTATTGTPYGVYGGSGGIGVFGDGPTGVSGYGTNYGVVGSSGGAAGVSGVYGSSSSAGGYGVEGSGYSGVVGYGSTTQGAGVVGWGYYGVYAGSNGTGGLAGDFLGDVGVTGTVTAAHKNFLIDHPLDAANKYLYHSSVESSEMMNIYTGNVVLDAGGNAVVQLPDWFQSLNTDFRYQLTAIGAPGPNLYIAQEVQGNSFRIAGGRPGMKVSWQVTGVRQDAYAKAHPLQVEVDKPASERGYYIHPELYGQPKEKSIEWARHPQLMRRLESASKPTEALKAHPELPKVEAPPAAPALLIPKPPEPAKLSALPKPPEK